MRQDRSTPITETAEEPTGCGPDGYGGFAHHHRSVLDHRRSRLTSAEQAWVRRQCQISFAARFDRETLEVETARYFYDDASEDDPFSEDST
ncbi:MAG TPA: hypothetical protein VN857_08935, partial [Chthoniobacterales bacterium]|nr:hypothetical protein [Chthoniobacterales bacterium]